MSDRRKGVKHERGGTEYKLIVKLKFDLIRFALDGQFKILFMMGQGVVTNFKGVGGWLEIVRCIVVRRLSYAENSSNLHKNSNQATLALMVDTFFNSTLISFISWS